MTDPLLVAQGQFNQVYLAIHKPSIVFSCLVNQVFTAWDDITEVTWNGLISGAYASVVPNMKLLVGTTGEGSYDLGIARIRLAPDATKLYIGRQSEVRFTNDAYLTVIDDFYLCARQWLVTATETFMDEDVDYVDQNVETEPVPVMGPDAAVWLTGASVTHQRNATNSWSPDGHSVSYLWSATGPAAVSINSATAANPIFTFTAVGEYRIKLIVTNATHTSKTTTAYRRTFVFGSGYLPVSNFELTALSSSRDGGYTKFNITLHDDSVLDGTYDQPRITLFAKDTYANTQQSFGSLVGFENVIAFGWGDQVSYAWKPKHNTMDLEVKGSAFWLEQIDIFAAGGLKSGTGTWLLMTSPTIDKAVWNLLHWRSNVDTIIDVLPSTDARTAGGLVANNGSLWEQVKDISSRIFAEPCCDRYGRLIIAVDPQMIAYASRSSISVIMDITKADWRENITIVQRPHGICSQVYLGGTDASTPYFSKAPGSVVSRWGRPQTKDNILVSGQAQTNQLTGDYYAWQNNPYTSILIPLRGNNRMIDVVPNQYVTLTVAAADNVFGLVWTAKRLIPRRISYKRNIRTGEFLVDLECEAEVIGYDGITYTPPAVPEIPTPPSGPTTIGYYVPVPSIKRFSWSFIMGDRSAVIGTGIAGMIQVPCTCKITSVVLMAMAAGNIVIDIWKSTYAQVLPGTHPVVADSIIGAGAKPTLAAGYKSSTALTSWNVNLLLGDWLFINVDSTDLTLVTLAVSGLAYQ